MSKVRDLMSALEADGFVNVEWHHTGGNCYAIRIPLGDHTRDDFSELLITGEDVFYSTDLDSDEDVSGDWYADRYDENGDSVTNCEGLIYTRDVPALIAALNASLEQMEKETQS